MSDIEDTVKKLQSHPGVVGLLVINQDGIPVRSTLEPNSAIQYACNFSKVINLARQAVHDLDNSSDVTFLRLHTKKYEIMMAPDKDYCLIVIQQPTNHK